MNKKLIAVALAGAFVLPLAAQAKEGNVKISGYLNLSLDYLEGGVNKAGNDLAGNWNVSSNSSKVVFSGDEDLGNGMSAVWEVTTYIGMGGTSTTDGTMSNGNSYVGLAGKSWGTVILGKHDTPFKLLGRAVDLFGNQIGDARNITSPGSMSGTGNTWDLRVPNTIAWLTPDWSGFSGAVAFSTNPLENGATTDSSTQAVSLLAKYANGPFLVGIAYEDHMVRADAPAATPNAFQNNPYAWRIAGHYKFGEASKVVALWQKSWQNSTFNNIDDDRQVWGLGFSQGFGNNTFKIQYYGAGDYGNISSSSANMWALGLDHNLSKRTQLYAAYARTNNDNNAEFSAFGGGHGDNPGALMGKNPWGLSFGIVHKF